MSRELVTALLLALSFGCLSCMGPNGPDGKDGNAYMEVTSSDGTMIHITTNNGALPSTFNTYTYYRVYPGTYSFDYTAGYYSYGYYYSAEWTGTYGISVNPGSPGGSGKIFWQPGDPGADGTDKHYDLDCNYYGLDIYSSKVSPPDPPILRPDTLSIGKRFSKDIEDDSYKIHWEYQLKNTFRALAK